jgi:transcriptional regulator with XRE-family HTH domain
MNIQLLLVKLNEKMSDAEIAAEINVSQPTATRLRNGKHKRTYSETADAIRRLAIIKGIITDTSVIDPTSSQDVST